MSKAKQIIAHTTLTPYEEACIVVLALLGVYTFFSWTGLLGRALTPTTNPAVLFVFMLIEWGIPIVLGVFGLTVGSIGFAKLTRKWHADEILRGMIYGITILICGLTLLGSAGYLLLLLF
jgi:hypothetical protein